MKLKVKIKRIDSTLPLPAYETDGSVGFDLLARADTVIAPQTIGLIPGNIIVEVPKGYMLMVASRSSTPRKKGLMKPHGIGVVDQDFCGPQDECKNWGNSIKFFIKQIDEFGKSLGVGSLLELRNS